MAKKITLVLGNGFTIDFVNFLKTIKPSLQDSINVSNLFSDGGSLRWPLDGRPGFLSFKHCPSLWGIGARSFLNSAQTLEILERVVTCANVYSLKRTEALEENTGNGFLHAYKELVTYLKYLFIHYDNVAGDIPDEIANWPWAKFIQQLNSDPNVEEIAIVSYNYDIWLERVLQKLNIDFEIPLLVNSNGSKIKIFKPHGSISYLHKKSLPSDSFSINYKSFFVDCPLSDISVVYSDLNRHTPVNFIIPPAGESGRSSNTWAHSIRSECISRIKTYDADDLAALCGISYWHVDRAEIDSLLNAMNSDMDVVHLNPYPSPTLDAVLNSLFRRYTHLSSSSLLEGYPI
jgi:hypothetical protein